MKYYLAIDLGGTNVRVAVVSPQGDVVEEIKRPSRASEGPTIVLDNIIDMAQSLKLLSDCLAIGMGLPGPVDTKKGCITLSTNLNGFTGFPVAAYLKERLNLPVYMDNDANVAGLAEAVFGAGKGNDVVYYLTHSTGIGGALVVNGKVVSGRKGYAGEIGNIIIDRDRASYAHINNLKVGAVENEASGSAMVRKAKQELDDSIVSAGEIFKLAEEGNDKAQHLLDEMTLDMGMLLQAIAHVCDPDIFVMGGGVTKSKDKYWPQMIAHYSDLVHDDMRDTPFVQAELAEPGIIGAAALCMAMEKGN
ncbi:ROK family protein [Erysipelothrix urinaevulpis]|uniref:ROK family protein n=1 Tax=Erysipelothrix urinaevulpis TaxID=2683717 RepID=UPI00135B4EE3|nr:ROK family protein [Erysipelothrix urinaevulpis]